MKRIIFTAVVLPFLVLAGCTKPEVEAPVEVSDEITVIAPALQIVDAAPDAPQFDQQVWHRNEHLSVFRKKNLNEHYELSHGALQNKAVYALTESAGTEADPLSANVAVCPYSPDYTVIEKEGGFEIQGASVPRIQKGEMGPMCAVSTTSSYTFDIPYAVVDVDLSNFGSYDGVLVRALGGESLAGTGNLVVNEEGVSRFELISGSSRVTTNDESSDEVFRARLVPGTLADGLYVEVLGASEKSSKIFPLTALEAGKLYHLDGMLPGEYTDPDIEKEQGPQQNNEIWVKTVDNVTPASIPGFIVKRDAESDWWKYETADGNAIETIRERLFSPFGCQAENRTLPKVVEFKLPALVKTIGESAFEANDIVQKVELPDGLESIGDAAFYSCSQLVSLCVPSTVKTIAPSAFHYSPFTNFDFQPAPETFAASQILVFKYTENTDLRLPVSWKYESDFRQADDVAKTWMGFTWKSITFFGEDNRLEDGEQQNNEIWVKTVDNKVPASIPGYIVKRDSKLEWWKYETADGNAIETIREHLFSPSGCQAENRTLPKVVEFKLPALVKTIGNNAFEGNGIVQKVELPEGLESIGEYAFYSCSQLVSLCVPSTVKTISPSAFNYSPFTNFDFRPTPEMFAAPQSLSFLETEKKDLRLPVSWKYESDFRQADDVANTWMRKKWKSITFFGEDNRLEEGPQQNNEIWVKTVDNKMPENIEGYIVKRDKNSNWWKYETADAQDITKLSDNLFYSKEFLTEVQLPETVTEIGAHVFEHCTQLRNVVLPEGLLVIGNYSFHTCSALKSLVIPSTVTSMGGRYLFSYCTFDEIKFLPLPETLMENVVLKNTENTVLSLPHAWKYESGSRKADATENTWMGVTWKSINFTGNDERVETGPQENNEIWVQTVDNKKPSDMANFIVKRDKNSNWWKYEYAYPDALSFTFVSLFANNNEITAVKLPAALLRIGKDTFFDCTQLTSVELPQGLIAIDEYAFAGTTALKELVIPENVESIGNAIIHRSGLTSLTVKGQPARFKTIENMAFYSNSEKNNAAIGLHLDPEWKYQAGISKVDENAKTWMSCTWGSIQYLREDPYWEHGVQKDSEIWVTTEGNVIPPAIAGFVVKKDADSDWWKYRKTDGSPVTEIAAKMFDHNKVLTAVILPETVTTVAQQAFHYAEKLSSVYLPEGLQTIEMYAFASCHALESLTIPSTVSTMADNSIGRYTPLKTLVFKPSPTVFQDAIPQIVTENPQNTVLVISKAWESEPAGYRHLDVAAKKWADNTWKEIRFLEDEPAPVQ